MLGLSRHPRLGLSTREIERRLRFLEEALERGSGRVSASTGDAADRLGEILAAAVGRLPHHTRRPDVARKCRHRRCGFGSLCC
jgi:hypothetical protein